MLPVGRVPGRAVDLADSALHAPQTGFDDDLYPDLVAKTAVLTCRLAWNHPLPDGYKRAAWAAMQAVAAGEVDEAWFADWLRARVRPA